MAKLYEIEGQFSKLVDFEINTDDDVQAFTELMKEVQGNFDVKAEAICKLIKNVRSDAEAFKAEKLSLEKKQKALENKAEALEKYLEYNARTFIQAGEKRKVGLFTLSFRKTPGKLFVDKEDGIPDAFFKKQIDISRLKDAVKSGSVFDGVRLESGETFIIS